MSRRRRIAFFSVLSLVVLGTVYSVGVAIAWAAKASSISKTVDDLSDILDQEGTALAALAVELEEKSQTAIDGVIDLVDIVDEQAQAEDDGVMYGWAAIGLSYCAEEMVELVHYVSWWPDYGYYGVRLYDEDVKAYCKSILENYDELLEEDS